MFESTSQSVNGDGNIVGAGDVYVTQVTNHEDHIYLYENDIVNMIKLFDEKMHLLDESDISFTDGGEFDYIDKKEKNKLNNLSDEYFEILNDDYLIYFYKIDEFLKNPLNKELQKKYRNVSLRLKTTIEVYRRKYNTFEEIIHVIANKLANSITDIELDPLVITVFVNYMYWNCDIGRKTRVNT